MKIRLLIIATTCEGNTDFDSGSLSSWLAHPMLHCSTVGILRRGGAKGDMRRSIGGEAFHSAFVDGFEACIYSAAARISLHY